MLKILKYFKNTLSRKILLVLWFNDYSLLALCDKLAVSKTAIKPMLNELSKAGIVHIELTKEDPLIRLDQSFRDKTSKILSKIMISTLFSLLGTILSILSKKSVLNQQKRLNKTFSKYE